MAAMAARTVVVTVVSFLCGLAGHSAHLSRCETARFITAEYSPSLRYERRLRPRPTFARSERQDAAAQATPKHREQANRTTCDIPASQMMAFAGGGNSRHTLLMCLVVAS
jgi:hypothetical protein